MLRESENSTMSAVETESVNSASHDFIRAELPLLSASLINRVVRSNRKYPPASDSVPTIRPDRVGAQPSSHSDRSSSSSLTDFALSGDIWMVLLRGLRQRFEAVQRCLSDLFCGNRVPRAVCDSGFLKQRVMQLRTSLQDLLPAHLNWTWLGSSDIHVSANGLLTVLDHNFSLPTGLELLSASTSPAHKRAVNDFVNSLSGVSGVLRPTCHELPEHSVMLVPGSHSSSGRSDQFLAQSLGLQEVRGTDLTISSRGVFLRCGAKNHRVPTILRRIDDELLDPNCLRPDSLVGIPGVIRAFREGTVDIISPPGSSLANSRSFTSRIPEMIREYLGEDPILNSAVTLECQERSALQHVMRNLSSYAIRTNDPLYPSRPLFGRTGRALEFSELLARLHRNPSAYIARPLLTGDHSPGVNIRIFSSMTDSFHLCRSVISRACQPDGGASVRISSADSIQIVNAPSCRCSGR